MSPRKQLRSSAPEIDLAVSRLWVLFGAQIRETRRERRWSIAELASRAGLSRSFVYSVEAGQAGSIEAVARLATTLGRRAEIELVDPRRQDRRANLSADPVHSAMGEFETGHLRATGFEVGIDVPYQHYQFAGRADVVAWDADARGFLHIENRTRFPDFQQMAGAYNAKRAYLAMALKERIGIRTWASETHVIAALWSSEVVHALRLRTNSFRALCPDGAESFADWWAGRPPPQGTRSILVVVDPLAIRRQRRWIDLETALMTRPRYRGYADAAVALATANHVPA
jgi:DNA-binding XRE family transcriptional regulator